MNINMKEKILYFECLSGISGDMTVAALLDLGADKEVLEKSLASLSLSGYKTSIGRRQKCGIDGCSFDVILSKGQQDNHSHDHSHGHSHTHDHSHDDHKHGEGKGCCGKHNHKNHNHDHGHSHEEHSHSHGEHTHDHSHDHSHDDHKDGEGKGCCGKHNHKNHNHDHGHSHEEHSHSHGEHTHDHSHDHSHDDHKHREGKGCCGKHNHKNHSHDHGHSHTHDHGHSHNHNHAGDHHHRNIKDIKQIIDNSGITDKAKNIAKDIFNFVAVAEAKAHNLPVDKVHFHEVGAVDSIVDIVAVAVCIDNLGVNKVCVSTLYEGTGFVKCQHGVIPVPVPAVVNILQAGDLNLKITTVQGEMVTPTGAAIVAALKNTESMPEEYKILSTGIGVGKKDFPHANILRAMIIEENVEEGALWMLETNVDDSTGEAMGYVMEELLSLGVNDVYFTPIYMKKNRPATMLSVLCTQEKITKAEDIIFTNLSTIGIRRYRCERTALNRREITLKTPYGTCRYKVCSHNGKEYFYPEYEDVKTLANQGKTSFDLLYSQLKAWGVSDDR